jgi:hypothetical protein
MGLAQLGVCGVRSAPTSAVYRIRWCRVGRRSPQILGKKLTTPNMGFHSSEVTTHSRLRTYVRDTDGLLQPAYIRAKQAADHRDFRAIDARRPTHC